jgi:hypothetical protein
MKVPNQEDLCFAVYWTPVTVAARSKAWTVFAHSNAGTVGSNTTQDMDVCVRLFCVCVGSDLATSWSPVQEVLPTVLRLRNWSETERFTDPLRSKVGATGKRDRVYWTQLPVAQNIQCRLSGSSIRNRGYVEGSARCPNLRQYSGIFEKRKGKYHENFCQDS